MVVRALRASRSSTWTTGWRRPADDGGRERITFEEGRVAFINGVAVALTTSAGVYVWSQSTGLAVVIGVSLVISMVAAGLAGVLIPVVLTVSGQDPAQASSIILTTVTDVVGFFGFLGLASLLAATL